MTDLSRTRGALEVLGRSECDALLRSRCVGRVGINRRGIGPLVVPVNYVVDDTGSVVFRTDVGTKLARIVRGAVSFQVDDVDPDRATGWSVLVEGLAHEVDPDSAAARTVEPWAPGAMAHAVRIVPTTVTGRRLLSSSADLGAG